MTEKLKLNKKTLRVLTQEETQLVAGGAMTDRTDTSLCPTDDCSWGGCGPSADDGCPSMMECPQPTADGCTDPSADCPPSVSPSECYCPSEGC